MSKTISILLLPLFSVQDDDFDFMCLPRFILNIQGGRPPRRRVWNALSISLNFSSRSSTIFPARRMSALQNALFLFSFGLFLSRSEREKKEIPLWKFLSVRPAQNKWTIIMDSFGFSAPAAAVALAPFGRGGSLRLLPI